MNFNFNFAAFIFSIIIVNTITILINAKILSMCVKLYTEIMNEKSQRLKVNEYRFNKNKNEWEEK